MRKLWIAIAAAAAMLPTGAYAKELSDTAWHKKFDDCLVMDNRGPNHDGEEFCVKSGKGMSQKQIEAYYASDAYKKLALGPGSVAADVNARADAYEAVGYKNCLRSADEKRRGIWPLKPSEEDCIAWAEAVKQKGIDMQDKALKELMEAK